MLVSVRQTTCSLSLESLIFLFRGIRTELFRAKMGWSRIKCVAPLWLHGHWELLQSRSDLIWKFFTPARACKLFPPSLACIAAINHIWLRVSPSGIRMLERLMGDLTQLQKDDFYLKFPIHKNISRRTGQSSGTFFSSPNTTHFHIIFPSSCPQYRILQIVGLPSPRLVSVFYLLCHVILN